MIFRYEAITNGGEKNNGTVDAISRDLAIVAIQRKGLIVSSVYEEGVKGNLLHLTIFKKKVSTKDIVIMSRQISTLFEAQVSALKIFTLLSENTANETLVKILTEVSNDIQAGMTISTALARHPEVFSDFYVNMVKSGEESGKLVQVFSYMAEYLDRQYQLTSKTKNALVYPSFVIGVFILVMILMFTVIVPKLAVMIKESGQEMPLSTKIVLGASDLLVKYWFVFVIILVGIVFYVIKITKTESGREYLDKLKLSVPVFKNIYSKLYISRIADNMDTMLSSGISILRAIELTGAVVGNRVFAQLLNKVTEDVKGGSSFSDALAKHKEIPTIMSGMVRVGEETGSMGNILKTLGKFYAREVNEEVDTMVGLIEPLMIVALGVGVGLLLTSVLMPIYNVAGGMG